MGLYFESDSEKSRLNEHKHGVSIEEAAGVFADPLSLTIHDPEHSLAEQRWNTQGTNIEGRLLVVVHTDRGGRIRIISARKATPRERKAYEEKK